MHHINPNRPNQFAGLKDVVDLCDLVAILVDYFLL